MKLELTLHDGGRNAFANSLDTDPFSGFAKDWDAAAPGQGSSAQVRIGVRAPKGASCLVM